MGQKNEGKSERERDPVTTKVSRPRKNKDANKIRRKIEEWANIYISYKRGKPSYEIGHLVEEGRIRKGRTDFLVIEEK